MRCACTAARHASAPASASDHRRWAARRGRSRRHLVRASGRGPPTGSPSARSPRRTGPPPAPAVRCEQRQPGGRRLAGDVASAARSSTGTAPGLAARPRRSSRGQSTGDAVRDAHQRLGQALPPVPGSPHTPPSPRRPAPDTPARPPRPGRTAPGPTRGMPPATANPARRRSSHGPRTLVPVGRSTQRVASLTAPRKSATAPGNPEPAGVDTNNASASTPNNTAPPADRAFAQINAPTSAKKISTPALSITPPRRGTRRHCSVTSADSTHEPASAAPSRSRSTAEPARRNGPAPRPARIWTAGKAPRLDQPVQVLLRDAQKRGCLRHGVRRNAGCPFAHRAAQGLISERLPPRPGRRSGDVVSSVGHRMAELGGAVVVCHAGQGTAWGGTWARRRALPCPRPSPRDSACPDTLRLGAAAESGTTSPIRPSCRRPRAYRAFDGGGGLWHGSLSG